MKATKYLFLSLFVLLTTMAAVLVSKPVPVSPKSNVLVTGDPDDIVFTWSKSGPAASFDRYEIQVAKDGSFAPVTIVDNSTIGNPDTNTYTIAPGTLDPAKRYYWRVRAVGTNGEPTAWVATYFRTAVLAPALLIPMDTDVLLNNRPTFEWIPVLNAESYTLQVSQVYDFSSLLVNVTIGQAATEYSLTTDLPVNKTLYWRMRTNNITFGPSAWSEVWELQTANPPGIPQPVKPNDGKLTDDYSPRLVWTQSSLPSATTFERYEIQVATNSRFWISDIVLDDLPISLTSIDKPCFDVNPTALPTDCGGAGVVDLDPATTYYWRVRAFNNAGEYSSWSPTFKFYTSFDPVVTLNEPVDGAMLTDNRPVMSWSPVAGAGFYRVIYSYNPTMIKPLGSFKVGGTSFIPPKAFPAGKTIYWRVQVEGYLYGPSRWSPTYSFNTANPPSAPGIISPKKVKPSLLTLTPTFVWSPPKRNPYPFGYYHIQIIDQYGTVLIDDDTTFTNLYNTRYTLDPADALNPAEQFYWRVRACNIYDQCSAWTRNSFFRTSVEAPILNSPIDGDSVVYPAPMVFDWDDVYGASKYTIQISTTPKMGKKGGAKIFDSGYAKTLRPGIYYWRVNATSAWGYGIGPWSEVRSFEVTP